MMPFAKFKNRKRLIHGDRNQNGTYVGVIMTEKGAQRNTLK